MTSTRTCWEVPSDLEDTKFDLMSMFSYGDINTTNIVERDSKFGDLFLGVAYQNCCMPQSLQIEELDSGEVLTLRDILSPEEDIFIHRTPIRLVGYLLGQQRKGEHNGPLAVDGAPTHFICRSRYRNANRKWIEPLQIVTLKYRVGWRIDVSECNGLRHIFEGTSSVVTANRLRQ